MSEKMSLQSAQNHWDSGTIEQVVPMRVVQVAARQSCGRQTETRRPLFYRKTAVSTLETAVLGLSRRRVSVVDALSLAQASGQAHAAFA